MSIFQEDIKDDIKVDVFFVELVVDVGFIILKFFKGCVIVLSGNFVFVNYNLNFMRQFI